MPSFKIDQPPVSLVFWQHEMMLITPHIYGKNLKFSNQKPGYKNNFSVR